MNPYQPHVFQGKRKKAPYFEGWYYKIIDPSQGLALCLIPGLALDGDDHAFIQCADSLTGQSHYIRYPLDQVFFSEYGLDLILGDQCLSDQAINIKSMGGMPYGLDVTIENPIKYPVTWGHPGIMGPFALAPFMECYHGVCLVSADLRGHVTINNKTYSLNGAKLYIEKDWGRSFPREWVWLEANAFKNKDVHFMLSVATIPWLKHSFRGHLGYLWLGDKRISLGTYVGSKVKVSPIDKGVDVCVTKGSLRIDIRAVGHQTIDLIAPSLGTMKRKMKEALRGHVSLKVYQRGTLIYEDQSDYAGIEYCGDIERL